MFKAVYLIINFCVSLPPMKKKRIFIPIILLLSIASVWGQQPRLMLSNTEKKGAEKGSLDKAKQEPKDTTEAIYVWRVNETTGERIQAIRDSIRYNFQQTTIPDGHSVAIGYLGNVGSPSFSKLFSENPYERTFYFWNLLDPYYKNPGKQLFYNTKIPYSNLYYQTGGSQYTKEERLKGEITSNFGKNFNLGFNIDYIYSRGSYQFLSNKSLNYNLFASYIKDRYEMHAWGGNYSFLNSENGGMRNDLFITSPNSKDLPNTTYTSTDLPVRMNLTWNRVRGRQLFFTNRYHLGYYSKEKKHINNKDTVVDTFVPVASFIFTSQYTHQYRRFNSYDSAFVDAKHTIRALDTLYTEKHYDRPVNDLTTLTEWKNTFGLSMREGFRDWVKFGLTAYIQHTTRRFSLPNSTENQFDKHFQNSVAVGGVLSKTSGKLLKYDLDAELSVAGYDFGQFKANAKLQTSVNIAGKEASLTATGYIKNLKANFLESNVQSKYFLWNKDMHDIRRVFAGGEIDLPQTGTRFSLGIENVQNYQYFNANKTIDQYSGSVQVLSARLDQKLSAGILHWDNQLVHQTTTNQSVIPVPQFSAYTNLYILTKLAKVLTIQAGVDTHFHTAYYAPGYEPALMAFYNQQDVKVGGFPMSTLYVNAHLKKTRFFVMYYNILKDLGNYGYFSLPHYPTNPFMFKWGLSWDFNN